MYFQIIRTDNFFYTSDYFNVHKNSVSGTYLNQSNVRSALDTRTIPFGCNVNDCFVSYGWGDFPERDYYNLWEQCIVWEGLPNKVLYNSARVVSVQDLKLLATENKGADKINERHINKVFSRLNRKGCRKPAYDYIHSYKCSHARKVLDIEDALREYPELYSKLIKLRKTELLEWTDAEDGYVTTRKSKSWKDQRKSKQQWREKE